MTLMTKSSAGVNQEAVGTQRIDPQCIISPSALAGDVNDYSPTGLTTAVMLRVDPGGAGRNITGIAATYHGHRITLKNIADGAESLTLKNESTASSAANRIYGSNNADVVLRRGGAVDLIYDAISARWGVVTI